MRQAAVACPDIENAKVRPGTDREMTLQEVDFRNGIQQVAGDLTTGNLESVVPNMVSSSSFVRSPRRSMDRK
jgi:hypothetical protein